MTPREFFDLAINTDSKFELAKIIAKIKADCKNGELLKYFVEDVKRYMGNWREEERKKKWERDEEAYGDEIDRLNLIFLSEGIPQERYEEIYKEILPPLPLEFYSLPPIPEVVKWAFEQLEQFIADTPAPLITDSVIDTSPGFLPPEWWEEHPELDTPEARKYFNRAIKRKFIKLTSTGNLDWIRAKRHGQGKNTLIALFCGMVYCGDEVSKSRYGEKWKLGKGGIFPDEPLKQIFGVKSLGAIRTNELDSSREKKCTKRMGGYC